NRGGPYTAQDSVTQTADVLTFSTTDSKAFDVMLTDPQTGGPAAAHPTNYSVTWKNISQGTVFGVDFTTGKVDAKSCGTIIVHAGAEILFNADNTCGLLQAYVAAPYHNAAKDKVIDLVKDGFSMTTVDPATGLISGAHPSNY